MSKAAMVGLLVLVGVGLTASPAQAQDYDTVELVGGGFVRGTVLVNDPGQPVVVALADGSTRTIEAERVARIVLARRSAPPALLPRGAPGLSAALAPPEGGPNPQADTGRAPHVQSRGVWRFGADEPRGEDEPWDPPTLGYGPPGALHVGIAGFLGVWAGYGADFFSAALMGYVDIRPDVFSPYRLRFGIGLSGGERTIRGSGGSFEFILARVQAFLLGLDIGDYLGLRLGGEFRIGDGERGLDWSLGPVAQLALQITPIEIGVENAWAFGSMESGSSATIRGYAAWIF